MPCCPNCIFKQWFSDWFCRACSLSSPSLPLFSLVFSISPEASWQYHTADFPQEIYFKVIPHFWERFIDRTQKHIWHSQPAESVSGWLLVTWPSASPLAFFFSQATIGHSEIRYLSSNGSTSRGCFSAAPVLPLKAWKSESRQLNPVSLSTFYIQDQIMTAFHKTQQKTSPTTDQYLGFSMWTYHSPSVFPCQSLSLSLIEFCCAYPVCLLPPTHPNSPRHPPLVKPDIHWGTFHS